MAASCNTACTSDADDASPSALAGTCTPKASRYGFAHCAGHKRRQSLGAKCEGHLPHADTQKYLYNPACCHATTVFFPRTARGRFPTCWHILLVKRNMPSSRHTKAVQKQTVKIVAQRVLSQKSHNGRRWRSRKEPPGEGLPTDRLKAPFRCRLPLRFSRVIWISWLALHWLRRRKGIELGQVVREI